MDTILLLILAGALPCGIIFGLASLIGDAPSTPHAGVELTEKEKASVAKAMARINDSTI